MTVRGSVQVGRTAAMRKRARLRAALEREPHLEAWQVAERFGMTVRQASEAIADELQRWRRNGR